jgi:hypothetical protein
MNIANADIGKRRILLVEDHEDDWELVAFKLREYKLAFARCFEEGHAFGQPVR